MWPLSNLLSDFGNLGCYFPVGSGILLGRDHREGFCGSSVRGERALAAVLKEEENGRQRVVVLNMLASCRMLFPARRGVQLVVLPK